VFWAAGGRPNTNNRSQYSRYLELPPRVLPAVANHRISSKVNYKSGFIREVCQSVCVLLVISLSFRLGGTLITTEVNTADTWNCLPAFSQP
jgi:hypothetical protein